MTYRLTQKKEKSPFPLSAIVKTGFCFLFLFVLLSCKNDMAKIYELESSNLPDLVVKETLILRSISGNLDIKVEAPVIHKFYSDSPKTEFPEGVFLVFYDVDLSIKSTLSAKYAVSDEKNKKMEARNHVVIIDYEKKDTIYTEQIIWDQNIRKIYSNKPVRQVNGDNVTYGDRFEMDENASVPVIFESRGTFEWEDD